MREKWIGPKDNKSGSYVPTICDELSLRRGGYMDAKRLYTFTSRFGEQYNITDKEVIAAIENMIEKEESAELYEYLYQLVIQKFGVMEFIKKIEHKIAEERSNGYTKGKEHMQKDLRKLIGL